MKIKTFKEANFNTDIDADSWNNQMDFEIEDSILKKYLGEEEEVVIPDGVRIIGEDAFANCIFLKKSNYSRGR